ncbi:MAG TPA: hypothetical protein VK890_09190, partial [Bacteroidia bacterium]|nr:hypothetical protein [Bacteroidia bacterium]
MGGKHKIQVSNLLIACLLIISGYANGQSWAPLGVNDASSTTAFGNGVTLSSYASLNASNPGVPPIDGQVYAMAANNASHILYVAGSFSMAYNSIGTSVSASNIAQWTAQTPPTAPYTQGTWATLPGGGGISGGNATVTAMVYDATHKILYIGGSFTSAGGVAVTNLAQLTITGPTWANVGGGVSGGTSVGYALQAGDGNNGCCPYNGGGYEVQALALDANNNLYVGGNFTTVGGATTANNIAEFVPAGSHNGTGTWYHLPTGNAAATEGVTGTQTGPGGVYQADPTVYAINIDANGNVWVGGQFTSAYTTAAGAGTAFTVNNIAEWIPTGSGTGTWYSLTTGGV